MIELFQFPFSHFCEKARWALDYKGLPFQAVNLLPGFHGRTVRKLAPDSCVPVLCDNGIIVQDSSAIIDYLDKRYPDPSLTPCGAHAGRSREWEDYLDEEIGVNLRRWSYYHRLPDSRLALRFLLEGSAWSKRPLFVLAYPMVRRRMRRRMNIDPDTAKQSERRVLAALDRLDDALDGRGFLVADLFSRADLTACAFLKRYCLPDDREAAAKFPAPLLKFRNELKNRRVYQWVRNIYKSYRPPLPVRGAAFMS